jgi:hypothetical protein
MESTLDSGSYWILQGILVILMLIGKLLLLISHDIPPSAKCYPPVAGIWRQGLSLQLILRVAWDLDKGASLMSSSFQGSCCTVASRIANSRGAVGLPWKLIQLLVMYLLTNGR